MRIQEIDVGSRIRAQRKRRKLSLNQLATMTGIAASNLSSIELNKSSPTLGTLSRIAAAFEMKISAFVEDIFYEKVVLCFPTTQDTTGQASAKVTRSSLTDRLSLNMMDATALTFEADSFVVSEEGSERFLYCVEGHLVVEAGLELYEVKKNSGIYLMPEIGAVIKNNSRSISLALIMNHKTDD